ncbi:MAG: Dabb family protein [bacterium]
MVKHIVMWQLKDASEGAGKAENAAKLKDKLEALQKTIPEIKSLEVGINFNNSDAAYDVVLTTEFENRQALQAYQNHPDHQRLISEFLNKVRSDKKVVDFEIQGSEA